MWLMCAQATMWTIREDILYLVLVQPPFAGKRADQSADILVTSPLHDLINFDLPLQIHLCTFALAFHHMLMMQ